MTSWTVGFCHCSGTCCCILFCPWWSCIQYGKNVGKLNTGHDELSCCDCCLYLICTPFCLTPCCVVPKTRNRIIRKYNIDEDGCWCDCCYRGCICHCLKHALFPCCALSQEADQLENGQVAAWRGKHVRAQGRHETARMWS